MRGDSPPVHEGPLIGSRRVIIGTTTLDWATFIASSIAAMSAIAVVVVYVIQTHILNQSRLGANLLEVLRWLQDEDMRTCRTILYQMPPRTPEELQQPACAEELSALEGVAHSFNSAAFMARKRMIPKGLLVENWGGVMSRCWPIVQPWAEYRRALDDGHKRLWSDFEQVATDAKEASPTG